MSPFECQFNRSVGRLNVHDMTGDKRPRHEVQHSELSTEEQLKPDGHVLLSKGLCLACLAVVIRDVRVYIAYRCRGPARIEESLCLCSRIFRVGVVAVT